MRGRLGYWVGHAHHVKEAQQGEEVVIQPGATHPRMHMQYMRAHLNTHTHTHTNNAEIEYDAFNARQCVVLCGKLPSLRFHVRSCLSVSLCL